MKIEEFHEKFALFQTCVEEWLDELHKDLHSLEGEPKPLDVKNVIRFPGNGKRKPKPQHPEVV